MKVLLSGFVTAGAGLAWALAAGAASFVPMNGTYYGLFYETNGAWAQSSGRMTIATTARGAYSAGLQIGWSRYAFSGRFDPEGYVYREILRFGRRPLRVEFQVDPGDPDLIYGTVGDGEWSADLYADRAVFDGRTRISPDAGQYTLAVLGDFQATDTPGGASVGTIRITPAARLTFVGTLADGVRVIQSTMVAKGGQWPLYVPVYRGAGSLHGWLQFNESADTDLSGDVTWIKPETPWGVYYPRGFATIAAVSGSYYQRPPAGTRILDFDYAHVEFNGGNLNEGITNRVYLNSRNRLENLSANGLRSWFSLANGAWSGSVKDPVYWDWLPFRGVVLQRYGIAVGTFFDWSRTGEVWLEGD